MQCKTINNKLLLNTNGYDIPIDYVLMSVGHLVHVLLLVYNKMEHV